MLLYKRCWIKLRGGRCQRLGQYGPCSSLRCTHQWCVPRSWLTAICGSNRTIIIGCSFKKRTPPVSRNICPANKKRCCLQQYQMFLPAWSIQNNSSNLGRAPSNVLILLTPSAQRSFPYSADLLYTLAMLFVLC